MWEAYCYKKYSNWAAFETTLAPMVISHAIGADGIEVIRTHQTEKVLCRFKAYKDMAWPQNGTYNFYSTFTKNQYATKMHSWGPQGTLVPYATSSDDWKSLIDEDGLGIICYYDELWLSTFTVLACKENVPDCRNFSNCQIFEFRLRPRLVTAQNLILQLFKRQCNNPCGIEPGHKYWPACVSTDCAYKVEGKESFIPIYPDDIKDDQEWTIQGKKIKGSDIKKPPSSRDGYAIQCVPVCIQSSTPPSGQVNLRNQFVYYSNHLYRGFEKARDSPRYDKRWIGLQGNAFIDASVIIVGEMEKRKGQTKRDMIQMIEIFRLKMQSLMFNEDTYKVKQGAQPGSFAETYIEFPKERIEQDPKNASQYLIYSFAIRLCQAYLYMFHMEKEQDYAPYFVTLDEHFYFPMEKLYGVTMRNNKDPFGQKEYMQLLVTFWQEFINTDNFPIIPVVTLPQEPKPEEPLFTDEFEVDPNPPETGDTETQFEPHQGPHTPPGSPGMETEEGPDPPGTPDSCTG